MSQKPRLLSELLDQALNRPEVLRTSRAQRVMRLWVEVVGPSLAERCVPDRFDKGTLWIAASGNAWAQEIRFHKDTILARLNELASESLFHDMRVGTRPPRKDFLLPLE